MSNMELTYAEHVEAYNKRVMDEYMDELDSFIRNIELDQDDFDADGFLSQQAYDKLNAAKVVILEDIKSNTKSKLKKI